MKNYPNTLLDESYDFAYFCQKDFINGISFIFDNEYANPVYAYTQNETLSLNIGSLAKYTNMLVQPEITLKDNIIKPYTLARFSANTITFENDLQYIDPKAFVRCSNLKAIVSPGEAEQLESSDYIYKYYNGSYYTTVNIMTGDAENATNEGVYIIRKSDAILICGLGTVLATAEQLDVKAVEAEEYKFITGREIDDFNAFLNQNTTVVKDEKIVLNSVLAIIQTIAISVATIMIIVLAIKYMVSSVSERAEIKKHAVVYVVGALLMFGASTIVQIIKNFSKNI